MKGSAVRIRASARTSWPGGKVAAEPICSPGFPVPMRTPAGNALRNELAYPDIGHRGRAEALREPLTWTYVAGVRARVRGARPESPTGQGV